VGAPGVDAERAAELIQDAFAAVDTSLWVFSADPVGEGASFTIT